MSHQNHNVRVEQDITVTIDESKFDDEFMADFRECFFEFHTIEQHVRHIGQLVARGIVDFEMNDPFIEGYGIASEMGISAKIDDVETFIE